MIVLLKQEDITRSLVMDLFGSFNGVSLCHHYDTFEVPAGAFTFTNGKGKKLSNKDPFITTFGIWIFNIFLIQGFDFSFLFGGYINSEINAGKYDIKMAVRKRYPRCSRLTFFPLLVNKDGKITNIKLK